MRSVFSLFLVAVMTAVSGAAQVVSHPDGEDAFRARMTGYIEKGNHYYYLSDRRGILSMVDSLDACLAARRESGLLDPADSLEYTAHRCRLLADWHYENGSYDSGSYQKAETLFKEALTLFSTGPFERDHDLFRRPVLYRELAQLYYRLERYGEALDYTGRAEDAYYNAYLNGYFFDGSQDWDQWQAVRMQKAMCLARTGRFDEALHLADSVSTGFAGHDDETRFSVQRMRGKILLLQGGEASRREAALLYKDYLTWRKADALKTMAGLSPAGRQDYWMQMRPFVADAYLLEDEDPALLYDIALFSKNLLLQMNLMSQDGAVESYLNHTWADIESALPQKSAAVEFVLYEGKMAALVVRKGVAPVWVKMPSQQEILDYRIDGRPLRSRLSSTDGNVKNPIYEDEGLGKLLWNAELLKALEGCRAIYFAPDGYVHQLAMEYMLPSRLRNSVCYRLTSTRQLLKGRPVSTDAALIIGGVDYNAELAMEEDEEGNDASAYHFMHDLRMRFVYLESSLEEARSVMAVRANPADLIYTGAAATEQVFRASAGRFPMLCISTHGFFQASESPVGTDVKTCMSDDALSESVLAFSGANSSIRSDSFNPTAPDGILSAAEIGGLDLSRVDIAVIAACQTGLGYVTSEGVYGIQRGFKNAGAGCLVVSLWNVSDKATSMLMSYFQRNLSQGMSAHAAFEKARESLSRKKGFNEPRYRNAFIMIDAVS